MITIFVGFILFTVILGYLCCEEHHSKSGRKLLSHSSDIAEYNRHTKLQMKVRGQLKDKIDLNDRKLTMYESLNNDSAVNTLPRPHRTKKKGHRQRKGATHQTPPMVFGDQGNLVTGAIGNQYYNYQLTDT